MFRSLRSRLVLSHILPFVLIIPLVGIAMAYLLETRLLLPLVYGGLDKDARLVAEISRVQPVLWENEVLARRFVDGISPYLSGQVSILALNGNVLASSGEGELQMGERRVELPDLSGVDPQGVVQLKNGPLAEVFTPVYDLDGRPLGVIRLTSRVVTVLDQVYQLRYLLAAILALGVLAGLGLGSYLALSLERPIKRVADSIQELAAGSRQLQVEEQGPAEILSLAHSFNVLVVRLNSLEQARRQLLANLVHELGRPLGAIRSAILALVKGATDDPQLSGELLAGLDGETLRLQRLLDDLAGLHDQVLGMLELDRQPVMLQDWLPEIVSPWEAAAREKGLSWTLQVETDLPEIELDPDRLAQALGNLLSNAVKFTPSGGQVAVSVRRFEKELVLEVADSGPGIPASEQERVFQLFYRGSQGRRIVQGMGLGLSIARQVAEAHGGRLDLESQPPEGSRFHLSLPL
ncbi:MAG: hypothetical protein A2Z16_11030 [Chloroflexi bacterium RBG_16_54_18]|nr:MAG: hypothetical protein A2Z16_11030 [Chloroflexi bacterium RBG_16_54_18]